MAPHTATLRELRDALGEDVVTSGAALTGQRFADWSGLPAHPPLALLRPRSTAEVAQALRICHRHGQPVVVQGGLSGLAGAACTQAGDIALNLSRMAAIEEVDLISGTMTVQAGAVLQTVQETARQHGRLFALDLGARGSCTIGGNLACNAGGVNVIQYGMAREQVLDLEAVLADGSVIGGISGVLNGSRPCVLNESQAGGLRKMVKNNTGLDLKQLLIGSEGTLGIITRATLKLRPLPTQCALVWCALPDYAAVTELLNQAQAQLPQGVSAFEVMWPDYCDWVFAHLPGLKRPLAGPHAFHVLLESRGMGAQHSAAFERLLADCMARDIIADAAIAQSTAQQQDFWRVREAPEHFPRLMPDLIAFDISFAIRDIAEAARACTQALRQRWPHLTTLSYGHLGDGNLHLIVDRPQCAATGVARQVEDIVYQVVADYHGSVSAEHGIGLKKQNVLHHTRSAVELMVMRRIKAALDPKHILNRGKVFPDTAAGPLS